MKINRTHDFYRSLLSQTSYMGDLRALANIQFWHWVSQKVTPNSLFLAFKGNKRDAFDFVEEVINSGAQVLVVSEEHKEKVYQLQEKFPHCLFILEDPLCFLTRSAQKVLATMPDLVKIGITGSNGKTSTKEILASVLANSSRSFYACEGNYNSLIGMSLSILQLTGKEEIAVFEMGINQKGDMDNLVELLRPQIAVITSFAQAHIGSFGKMEALVKEKIKIARYAQQMFCSCSCVPWLSSLENLKPKAIIYSLKDKRLERLNFCLSRQSFRWNGEVYSLAMAGEGALLAARCVLELAHYLNLSCFALKKGFAEVKLPSGRMQIVRTAKNVYFLNDAYNANLSSLEVLLIFLKDNASRIGSFSRSFFIFSGFKELGDYTYSAHEQSLRSILTLPWQNVFLLGEELRDIADAFGVSYFETVEESLEFFQNFFISQDFVVLKGARYYALERIIDLFN